MRLNLLYPTAAAAVDCVAHITRASSDRLLCVHTTQVKPFALCRHGRYYTTDETRLLFGAKRPHVPLNCTLYRSEVVVRAELQWDHIFRFMNFSTNL